MEISLFLLEPHRGQKRIQADARRYNAIPCARRFGKTELISAVEMPLISPVLEGKLVAIFAPVFKDVAPLWEAIIDRYKMKADGGLIKKKDETKKVIHFITGGRLDFWSLKDKSAKDNGRGRKYHRVIYEETQKINENVITHNWQKAISPTLLDYGGEAYFIGTANGRSGFFYDICRKGAKAGDAEKNHIGEVDLPQSKGRPSADWITFRMITTDNPYMSPERVAEAAEEVDDLTFRQEYFSEFVDYAGAAWCYALTEKTIQNKVFKTATAAPVVNFRDTLYLSFDFNKIPMTAIAAQRRPLPFNRQNAAAGYFDTIEVIKEFRTEEKVGEVKNESSIYDTCRLIREWIFAETGRRVGRWSEGAKGMYFNSLDILVTGDASGDAADGRQRVPVTYYDIISEELNLNRGTQIKIQKQNPRHAESYVQVNTLLQRHPNFTINVDLCPYLKKDMLTIKADARRGIQKSAGAGKQADLLDCLRYFLWTFCR